MSYSAAIFDLDGTLVDNMRFHFDAWIQTGRLLGIELTEQRIQREFAGKKGTEILRVLLGNDESETEIQRISDEKEAMYRKAYIDQVALTQGAGTLLSALRERGVHLAIASAAPPENRAMVLGKLALGTTFSVVVGGEQAKRGKPAPDLFLLAAEKLGVQATQAVVFEDAVLGVQAAKAAGAFVVGVTTSESETELREAGAELVVRDFTDPRLLPLFA